MKDQVPVNNHVNYQSKKEKSAGTQKSRIINNGYTSINQRARYLNPLTKLVIVDQLKAFTLWRSAQNGLIQLRTVRSQHKSYGVVESRTNHQSDYGNKKGSCTMI